MVSLASYSKDAVTEDSSGMVHAGREQRGYGTPLVIAVLVAVAASCGVTQMSRVKLVQHRTSCTQISSNLKHSGDLEDMLLHETGKVLNIQRYNFGKNKLQATGTKQTHLCRDIPRVHKLTRPEHSWVRTRYPFKS